ncbi:MAG TPA: FAD-dependent oxidoreductase [Solirubrobacteraceae bacterium]|nr:FAD-dependent oxidoreductase [Solirubrobacteraceae bacterium]
MLPLAHPQIVIAGGGVAAIEALLALRHVVGEQASVTLLAPERSFVHRPSSVGGPFGLGGPGAVDLAALARDQGAELVSAALEAVDPARRVVRLGDGGELSYERLIVAVGAVPKPAIPGSVTFAGPAQAAEVVAVLDRVERREARRLIFAVPREATWSLPVYELAIMAAVDLRDRGVANATLGIVTPEPEPLRLFGAAAGAALRAMLDARGITLWTNTRPLELRDGLLHVEPGGPLRADAVISVPVLEGPALAGLPADSRGFLPVDAHGRVIGAPGVYAAGDATAFPVKQGGLATQQADAVVDAVAADLGLLPDPAPFRPVLRGLLLTGGAPLYLRAELTGDTAPTAHALRGEASGRALWWPPGKVAGRYLAPYLGTARPVDLGSEPLRDRAAAAAASPAADRDEAYRLALLLAREDAKVGDYRQALHALDAAAALAGGVLPDEWTESRARWQRELSPQS